MKRCKKFSVIKEIQQENEAQLVQANRYRTRMDMEIIKDKKIKEAEKKDYFSPKKFSNVSTTSPRFLRIFQNNL